MIVTVAALVMLVALVPLAYLYGLDRGWQQARGLARKREAARYDAQTRGKPW